MELIIFIGVCAIVVIIAYNKMVVKRPTMPTAPSSRGGTGFILKSVVIVSGAFSACMCLLVSIMVVFPPSPSVKNSPNIADTRPTVNAGTIPTATLTPVPLTTTPIPIQKTNTPQKLIISCQETIEQDGWDEPQYEGLNGFLVATSGDISDYYDSLPPYPWQVPILEQVGPTLWRKGDKTLPAKTPVIVVKQHLKHKRYGFYSGFLTVKSLEDSQEYKIDIYNFSPSDYWNCSPYRAVMYSNFIARVKDGTKPVDKQGVWAEMGDQREVFCTDRADINNGVRNGVTCIMYKQYGRNFGGSEYIFPSEALEIIY